MSPIGFVILHRDGTLKTRKVHYGRRPGSVFATEGAAKRFATEPGDSVVRVYVDMTVAPVFIRPDPAGE